MNPKYTILCGCCSTAAISGDLSSLDYHLPTEDADRAAEVIESIDGEQVECPSWAYICDACGGTCRGFANEFGSHPTAWI